MVKVITTTDQLLKEIRMLGNIKIFDPDVKKTARQSVRRLTLSTPRRTGDTRRAWSNVKKIVDSFYKVSNTKIVGKKKKWYLVNLLNYGTRRGLKRLGFLEKEKEVASNQLTELVSKRVDSILMGRMQIGI